MAQYQIEVTESARDDLSVYTVFERKTIASAMRAQLTYQPMIETRQRKKLRDNPVASWELRVGKHRVFYEIDERSRKVGRLNRTLTVDRFLAPGMPKPSRACLMRRHLQGDSGHLANAAQAHMTLCNRLID